MKTRLAVLALLVATSASAQDATPLTRPVDQSIVDGDAGARMQGVAGVNLAAGTGNAQANVRSIAAAPSGRAVVSVSQSLDAAGADMQRDARAVLAGSAFESAQGVLGINQVAGSANAQANVLVIGPRATSALGQEIDNLALSSIRVETDAGAASAASPSGPLREARIDGSALRAPSGVLQINQTAGVGNASANAIVLQLPGGTP